jgi:hypothetical protein
MGVDEIGECLAQRRDVGRRPLDILPAVAATRLQPRAEAQAGGTQVDVELGLGAERRLPPFTADQCDADLGERLGSGNGITQACTP